MGDYAGIGPGAHGRLTLPAGRMATNTLRAPEAWLSAVQAKGTGETPREALSDEDRAVEYLMMSLRLSEGCDLARFAEMKGKAIPTNRINPLIENGFLQQDGDMIRATTTGRLILNRVLLELAA
jgi:oxygen-independent coproporphyrinogen-3 oxidase